MIGLIIMCSISLKLDFNLEKKSELKQNKEVSFCATDSVLKNTENLKPISETVFYLNYTNIKPKEKQKFINSSLNTNIF